MNYRTIFERTFDRLDALGIDYTYIKTSKAEANALKRVEKAVGLMLPASLRAFYTGFSGNILLTWFGAEQRGGLEVPFPKDLAASCKNFRDIPSALEDFQFAPSMGEARAVEIAQRMKSWIPFDVDGEGNSLCLDCGTNRGAIVYYQHDWFSGDGKPHGHLLAPDFATFVLAWSRVCFVNPSYWPDVFADEGIDWDAEQFPEAFRL